MLENKFPLVVVICSRAPTGHVHGHTIYVHMWLDFGKPTELSH